MIGLGLVIWLGLGLGLGLDTMVEVHDFHWEVNFSGSAHITITLTTLGILGIQNSGLLE